MVVAMLGILKAGGAYLPLAPDYPAERLSYILAQSQITVVATQAHLIERLSDFNGHILDLDQPLLRQDNPVLPPSSALQLNLAYVLYTSGSTGKPKGVAIQHHSIVNHMLWLQQTFPVTPNDRILQRTPFTFDASLCEFFGALMAGAALVILPSPDQQDVRRIIEMVADHHITILQTLPSLLSALLEQPDFASLTSLRRLVCGAEALPSALRQRALSTLHVEFCNLYGPTEATIDTVFWISPPQPDLRAVPIGRPIANVRAYILDEKLTPTPIGVPGELYIGGEALTRGYLYRPDLTAERFIPDPFQSGGRLYRTGDLARFWLSGEIEYLGRSDQQVKLRGFRIELGEIEAVLSQHPSVHRSVITLREDKPGDKRLVGYIVSTDEGAPPSVNELRRHLAAALPEYMIPATFVFISALPLTTAGKIDRKALPVPDAVRPDLQNVYTAPRSPVEELIALIWAEVLQLRQIGIDDNFFELGGHSLRATQVISRLRTAFNSDLPLRTLFESPTVRELADSITRSPMGQALEPAPALIRLDATQQTYPLSFAQERLWFWSNLILTTLPITSHSQCALRVPLTLPR